MKNLIQWGIYGKRREISKIEEKFRLKLFFVILPHEGQNFQLVYLEYKPSRSSNIILEKYLRKIFFTQNMSPEISVLQHIKQCRTQLFFRRKSSKVIVHEICQPEDNFFALIRFEEKNQFERKFLQFSVFRWRNLIWSGYNREIKNFFIPSTWRFPHWENVPEFLSNWIFSEINSENSRKMRLTITGYLIDSNSR